MHEVVMSSFDHDLLKIQSSSHQFLIKVKNSLSPHTLTANQLKKSEDALKSIGFIGPVILNFDRMSSNDSTYEIKFNGSFFEVNTLKKVKTGSEIFY